MRLALSPEYSHYGAVYSDALYNSMSPKIGVRWAVGEALVDEVLPALENKEAMPRIIQELFQ